MRQPCPVASQPPTRRSEVAQRRTVYFDVAQGWVSSGERRRSRGATPTLTPGRDGWLGRSRWTGAMDRDGAQTLTSAKDWTACTRVS